MLLGALFDQYENMALYATNTWNKKKYTLYAGTVGGWRMPKTVHLHVARIAIDDVPSDDDGKGCCVLPNSTRVGSCADVANRDSVTTL